MLWPMEFFVPITVKLLPEGAYLATSDALPGLVAQGRTAAEAFEIAQDVARKLIESYREHGDELPDSILPEPPERLFLPVTA